MVVIVGKIRKQSNILKNWRLRYQYSGRDWESFNPYKRVAAYARVSTDLEEQTSSFEAQIDYYTKLINNHLEWKLEKYI